MSWKYRSTKFRQFINGWIDYFYMAQVNSKQYVKNPTNGHDSESECICGRNEKQLRIEKNS